jgi:hypothetical protein
MHARQRRAKRLRELIGAAPIVLQQVISDALRRTRPDAGKHTQCLDQSFEPFRRRDRFFCHRRAFAPPLQRVVAP